MNINSEMILSFYKEIAILDREDTISVVQNTQNNKIYLKKTLTNYDPAVYKQLMDAPVSGIPRVYVACEENDSLIVIEEYISGFTLSEILEKNGKMPEEIALDNIIQLCRIVNRLHSVKPPIIHRDIKPENLIITSDNRVILIDLNTAKFEKPSQKVDTKLLGTMGYAAPEQYGFAASNRQTDIYAIGILLNTMLTYGESNSCIESKQIGRIIKKCTQLNPADRYNNIDDLVEDLENIQSDRITSQSTRKPRHFREYLPPGFRSHTPWHMIVASVYYGVSFYIAFFSPIINNRLFINFTYTCTRFFLFALFLLPVFVICDYLEIRNLIPLCRSNKKSRRVVGCLLLFLLLGVVLGTLYFFSLMLCVVMYELISR